METLKPEHVSFSALGKWTRISLIVVFIIGILIRVVQYLGGISYWMDELFNVVNLENMSMSELLTTQPEYNQVVAPGYYLVQKGLLLLVGQSSELLLRLYPVICSITALFLLYKITARYLKGLYLVITMALICTALGSWFYGTSAKPYAVELMYIVFITLSLLRMQEGPLKKWQYLLVGLIGGFGTFSSLICTAFLAGAVPYLFWTASKENKKLNLVLTSSLWILGGVLTVLYTLMALDPTVKDAMGDTHAYGFPPSSIAEFPLWVWSSFYEVMFYFLAITFPIPFINIISTLLLILGLLGIYALLKKDLKRGVLLALFIAMNFSLALLYILPLTSRYGPATFWVFIIFAMYGLAFLREKVPFIKKWLVYSIAIILALPSFLMATLGLLGLPNDFDPTEKLLVEIKKELQPEQQILVHPRAYLQIDYYAPKNGFDDYYIMHSETTPEELTAKLDNMDLDEAWFVVANILEYPSKLTVESFMEVFDQQAEEVKRIALTEDTFAVLYDFK